MLVCTLFDANRTRDRGCSAHPVFPTPSVFRGQGFLAKLRAHAPRERETVFSRHCEPTGRANARPMTGSAKQSISPRKERMDCFAGARNDVDIAGSLRPDQPQNAVYPPSITKVSAV